MLQWIQSVIAGSGYPGLIFLTFIENVFPPIPSELILPFAGSLARKGSMSFVLAVLCGTLGATLGSLPLYYAGSVLGEKRMRAFLDSYGIWVGVDGTDLDKTKKWFAKHQGKAVFAGRLVPGIRGFIAIPAGLAKMPMAPFLALTFAGCGAWSLLLTTLGFLLGPKFAAIDRMLGPVSKFILLALVAWLIWRGIQKRRKHTKRRR